MSGSLTAWLEERLASVPALASWLETLAWPDAGAVSTVAAAATAAVLLAVLAARRSRRGAGEPVPTLRAETRRQRLVGWMIVLAAFGGGGAWAALAPLASAAIAPAVVGPEGKRKTIQHLEGGIIRTIDVREGSLVRAGDPLVTLEDVRARTEHNVLRDQHRTLRATVARLEAEQAERPELVLPAELVARFDEPAIHNLVSTQQALFAAGRAERDGRRRITGQRIAQLQAENASLERQITSLGIQAELILDEIKGVRSLLRKGLERRPRLLALQRSEADISGQVEALRGKIAGNEQAIAQAELEQLTAEQQDRLAINAELDEARIRLDEVRNRLPSSRDALARTVVRAPTDGEIVDLKATTLGGVLAPGEPILDLVPSRVELLVEARLQPRDAKDVRRGLPARVVLTAYPQRDLPIIHGLVREISADRLTDERTGEPYFSAQVAVDEAQLVGLDDAVALMSGMPAEVMIVTGERSFLDYLLRPLYDTVRKAFRER